LTVISYWYYLLARSLGNGRALVSIGSK
jgi:hypothetical protein